MPYGCWKRRFKFGEYWRNKYIQFRYHQKSFPLFSLLANKRDLCSNCWARNLCEGCPRELFYDEKNKCYQTTPNEDKCKSQREHIEKILLSISHLRQDKNKWHDYVQGINEMCKEKIC